MVHDKLPWRAFDGDYNIKLLRRIVQNLVDSAQIVSHFKTWFTKHLEMILVYKLFCELTLHGKIGPAGTEPATTGS